MVKLVALGALASFVVACGSSSGSTPAGADGSSSGSSGSSSGSSGSSGSTPTTALSVGVDHSCATRASDGATYCWGDNAYGQVGDNTQTTRLAPVSVSPEHFAQLAAGGTHSCGLTKDGRVRCWGLDVYGTVGTGTTSTVHCVENEPCVQTPTAVIGLAGAVQIAAGTEHTCALTSDGGVWCWGDNRLAEVLGTPTDNYTAKPTPTRVAPLAAASAVAAGGNWSCAVLRDTTVSCWGNDPWNQDPKSAPTLPITVGGVARVAGLDHVTEVALSNSFACARIDDGTARCWGSNTSGQLGDGTTTTSAVPVAVAGVSGVKHVVVGASHACALLDDGSITCWGDNALGELGDGTKTGTDCIPPVALPPSGGGGTPPPAGSPTCRPHAQAVKGLANVEALALGGNASCARLADQSIACWGTSQRGLGDGTSEAHLSPVPIAF
jgi:alpha-tubulin suppressor-like RCC1 family protein